MNSLKRFEETLTGTCAEALIICPKKTVRVQSRIAGKTSHQILLNITDMVPKELKLGHII